MWAQLQKHREYLSPNHCAPPKVAERTVVPLSQFSIEPFSSSESASG